MQFERLIGKFHGASSGPTMVVVAAIHGNEPAGIEAARQFLDFVSTAPDIAGDVYCFVGNVRALEQGRRYIDWDLNRLWDAESPPQTPLHEWHELSELKQKIDACFEGKSPNTCLLVDLHTTSGETIPFAPVTDHPLNKALLKDCPFPVILGIEEFVTGGMIEYFNRRGIAALGFEGGSHMAPDAVRQHFNFLVWAAQRIGLLRQLSTPWPAFQPRLWYEIHYVHRIIPDDGFVMLPGFRGFEKVSRGQVVARSAAGWVYAPISGLLFMPLYQKQGHEGFYIIRRLSLIKIIISTLLTALGLGGLLCYLPGIKHHEGLPGTLSVTYWADRLFGRRLMRRLGYRRRWVTNQEVLYQKIGTA